MSESLWAQVAECFDTDDGSLPGIEVARLSPVGLADVYAMLRRRSVLVGDNSEFWSRTEEASLSVDSVPNAAVLVADGRSDPFHIGISGLVAGGVELPMLGVFVWQDVIELDYRMGRDWGPSEVAGFFELLRDCCALDPGGVIIPADFEGPPYPDRFVRAWSSYNSNGTPSP